MDLGSMDPHFGLGPCMDHLYDPIHAPLKKGEMKNKQDANKQRSTILTSFGDQLHDKI